MKRAMLASLRFYKRRISPHPAARVQIYAHLFANMPCRPWSAMARSTADTWRPGGCCAATRFARGGYDPVPERVPDTIIRKDEN